MPRKSASSAPRGETPPEMTEEEKYREACLWLSLHPEWDEYFKISPEEFSNQPNGYRTILEAYKNSDSPSGMRFYYELCHYTNDFSPTYTAVKTVRTWMLLHNMCFQPVEYSRQRTKLYILMDVVRMVDEGTFATEPRIERILSEAFASQEV